MAENPSLSGHEKTLKYSAVVILCIQNTAFAVLSRYLRTRKGTLFLNSTVIVMSEVVKLTVCVIASFFQEGGLVAGLKHVNKSLFASSRELCYICVPAISYSIQNNLFLVAVSHLEVQILQVTGQLRILTTAIFFVLMLKRKFSIKQWLALISLGLGIALCQHKKSTQSLVSDPQSLVSDQLSRIYGFGAIISCCILSGFTSVYFEKVLKNTKPSIITRNIQLAFLSSIFSLIGTLFNNMQEIKTGGFYQGYDILVFTLVLLHSLGGIAVAAVIKYADNMIKTLSTGMSIILSTLLSVYFFKTEIFTEFLLGSTLVIISIFVYNAYPYKVPDEIMVQKREEKDIVIIAQTL